MTRAIRRGGKEKELISFRHVVPSNFSAVVVPIDNYIKYSLDFLRPIKTAEAFEAVDWLADLPQQRWLQV